MNRRMRMLWAGVLLAAGVATGEGTAVKEWVLARDGEAAAHIVIATNATRAAQFAAYELEAHLEKITGADFAITTDDDPAGKGLRLLVGESRLTHALGVRNADFKNQEYTIRFLPDAIILAGRDKEDRGKVSYDAETDPSALRTWPDFFDEQGTMYAVYDFLERFCNVRWFDHTEAGTDIPEAKTLAVTGDDVRRAPAFRYRHVPCPSNTYDAYLSLWPRDSEGFKRWEAAAYAAAHQSKSYSAAKQACVQRFRYRMREGGEKCLCNHSLYHYYDLYWEPRPGAEKHFAGKRPELFAQGYEGDKPPQMCYTSAELIDLVAQEARDYFDKGGYPYKVVLNNAPQGMMWGENFFAVEPMDNSLFCKCPKCRELLSRNHSQADNGFYSQGMHSDYFFYFVNEVAKRVRKTHPDKWIVTLAYMTHAYPPESFHLEPNVAVQFCFASNRRPASRGEYENEIKALAVWAEEARTSGRPLYLWLFYTFPVAGAHGGKYHCFPGFFAQTIGEQFQLFRDYGYRGMLHCGYGQEVESYVTYKLMDDPTLNVEDLLDEYFTRLYGAAGQRLKELYFAMESAYSDPANYPDDIASGKRSVHQTVDLAWGCLGTKERMDRLRDIMERARNAIDGASEIQKRRFELFELSIWEYVKKGKEEYQQKIQALPVTGPLFCPWMIGEPANGDLDKVTWEDAQGFNRWRSRYGECTKRKVRGEILHDEEFLYIRLEEVVEAKTLKASDDITDGDYWQVLIADKDGTNLSEILVNPDGKHAGLAHGQGNRKTVPWNVPEQRVKSDTTGGNQWHVALAIPLTNLPPAGLRHGGVFRMNAARRAARSSDQPVAAATFGDFTNVERFIEITLETRAESVPLGAAISDEGLIGKWSFERNGKTVKDLSGNGNHGRVHGSPNYSKGPFGRAVEFYHDDSMAHYIEVAKPDTLASLREFTISAWINVDPLPPYQTLSVQYAVVSGLGGLQMYVQGSEHPWMSLPETDGKVISTRSWKRVFSVGKWEYLAVSYDGETVRMFVNGRKAAPGVKGKVKWRDWRPFRMGINEECQSWFQFNGKMDEVMIFNRALLPAEIASRYEHGLRAVCAWEGKRRQ